MLTKTENGIKFYEHNEITDLKNQVAALPKEKQIKKINKYLTNKYYDSNIDFFPLEEGYDIDANESKYINNIWQRKHPFEMECNYISAYFYDSEIFVNTNKCSTGDAYGSIYSNKCIIFDASFNNYVIVSTENDTIAYSKVITGDSPDNNIFVIESVNKCLLDLTSHEYLLSNDISSYDIMNSDVVVFNTDTVYFINYPKDSNILDNFKKYTEFKRNYTIIDNSNIDILQNILFEIGFYQVSAEIGLIYDNYSFELIDKAIEALAKVCTELQEILV